MDGIRLETERLLLRRFAEDDAVALWRMCSDELVTRYLPFDELKSLEGAQGLLEEKFLALYRRADAGEAGADGFSLDARWAICEKGRSEPIGLIQIDLALGVQTYRGYWEQHPDHWIEEGL